LTSRRIVHGSGRVLACALLTFITEAEHGSYAVELQRSHGPFTLLAERNFELHVKLGSIGAGNLGHDRRLRLQQERIPPDACNYGLSVLPSIVRLSLADVPQQPDAARIEFRPRDCDRRTPGLASLSSVAITCLP